MMRMTKAKIVRERIKNKAKAEFDKGIYKDMENVYYEMAIDLTYELMELHKEMTADVDAEKGDGTPDDWAPGEPEKPEYEEVENE